MSREDRAGSLLDPIDLSIGTGTDEMIEISLNGSEYGDTAEEPDTNTDDLGTGANTGTSGATAHRIGTFANTDNLRLGTGQKTIGGQHRATFEDSAVTTSCFGFCLT